MLSQPIRPYISFRPPRYKSRRGIRPKTAPSHEAPVVVPIDVFTLTSVSDNACDRDSDWQAED